MSSKAVVEDGIRPLEALGNQGRFYSHVIQENLQSGAITVGSKGEKDEARGRVRGIDLRPTS
jgi:hypothetical protein